MSSGIGIRTSTRWLVRGIGLIVVLVLACSILLYVVSAMGRSDSTEDQYAVWSAFLNSALLDGHDWGADGRCLVVLQGHTVRHFGDDGTLRDSAMALLSLLFGKKPIAQLSSQTFRSFRIRNIWRESVTSSFRINGSYEVATQKDIELFAKPEQSQRRFSGSCGYVELSAVGFNSAHSEAFFRADHFCGLCGGGGYVLMTKINGEWRVVKWDLFWVS